MDLYIYIHIIRLKTVHIPYDYHSEEARLQPVARHSLKPQATNLRNIVRYLEHTMQCEARYSKSGSPYFIGPTWFSPKPHRGIRARPQSPNLEK